MLGTAPYRGRPPYGVYRFTVVAADGYGEYLRDVQRGGLDLDTTIRPTREVIGGMVEISAGTYAIGFDYAALLPAHPRAFDDQMFKKPTKWEIPAFLIDRRASPTKSMTTI